MRIVLNTKKYAYMSLFYWNDIIKKKKIFYSVFIKNNLLIIHTYDNKYIKFRLSFLKTIEYLKETLNSIGVLIIQFYQPESGISNLKIFFETFKERNINKNRKKIINYISNVEIMIFVNKVIFFLRYCFKFKVIPYITKIYKYLNFKALFKEIRFNFYFIFTKLFEINKLKTTTVYYSSIKQIILIVNDHNNMLIDLVFLLKVLIYFCQDKGNLTKLLSSIKGDQLLKIIYLFRTISIQPIILFQLNKLFSTKS